MYYKVLKDGKPIDVLNSLTYVKYQPKHDIFLLAPQNEAQGILSSDGKTAYHDNTMIACNNMVNVDEIIEIRKYEYDQLKHLQLKTYEEIVDSVVSMMIQRNML